MQGIQLLLPFCSLLGYAPFSGVLRHLEKHCERCLFVNTNVPPKGKQFSLTYFWCCFGPFLTHFEITLDLKVSGQTGPLGPKMDALFRDDCYLAHPYQVSSSRRRLIRQEGGKTECTRCTHK